MSDGTKLIPTKEAVSQLWLTLVAEPNNLRCTLTKVSPEINFRSALPPLNHQSYHDTTPLDIF
jgi:hypothetical protein